MINGYAAKIEALGPHVVKAATTADGYACEMIALLKEIRDATSTGYDVDVYETPSFTFTASTEVKEQPGRAGFIKLVKRVAIIAAGAADVDVYVGSIDNAGFRKRISFTGAGRSDQDVTIPVPEGASVFVTSSVAGITANLVIQRIEL